MQQLKELIYFGLPFGSEAIDKTKVDWEEERVIVDRLQDTLTDLKRCIVDSVDCWNIK